MLLRGNKSTVLFHFASSVQNAARAFDITGRRARMYTPKSPHEELRDR